MPLIPRRGRPIYAAYWLAVSLAVIGLDYVIGPTVQLTAIFIIPVSLAAWYNGWPWGLALAVALPLVRLYFTTILETPWSFTEAAINAGIRILVLGSFAVAVDRVAHTRALNRRMQILEGMLPICAVCKRIRGEDQRWQRLDQYLLAQSKDQISNEVCPDCSARLGETFDRR
jgi:hypothetical protein